jgi:ankyrin repeat protein
MNHTETLPTAHYASCGGYEDALLLRPLHSLLLSANKTKHTCPAVLARSDLAKEQDGFGRTLLHLALDYGMTWMDLEESHLPTLAMRADYLGRLPIHVACANNWFRHDDLDPLREMLPKLTKDLDKVDDNGRTPLHNAVAAKDVDTIGLLLRFNGFLDTEVRDKDGLTPAAYAALGRDWDMMSALWYADADFNVASCASAAFLST